METINPAGVSARSSGTDSLQSGPSRIPTIAGAATPVNTASGKARLAMTSTLER